MATTIKISTYLWVTCIFVLLANLAVMITLYLYQIPLLKKLSHPLIISIFLAETLKLVSYESLYQDSRLENTKEMLVTLIIFCWVILDIFLPNSKGNSNEENNEENEGNNNDNENVENNDTSAKKIDLKNFDFSTALFAVIMWITYMMNGMVYFNFIRNLLDLREREIPTLQKFFYFVFHFATLQFVYGTYVLNQNVSKLFYLIYMIPQALLWPIASIISYYVHQENIVRMMECHSVFNAFMAGTLLYSVFKIYYQYPEYVKDENKNKGFHIIFLIIGFVWYGLINATRNINN